MAPSNLWGSSDASSSIYSNDDDEAPLYSKPLVVRKDSASANSTYSTTSKNSTVYSEDSIKSMGYRPFEYWKGPKPAAAPSTRRPPPPLPPPRFTGTNHMKTINSLQDFKPLPKAKVLEVQTYMTDAGPPSPRVKDRYAARMAERARRKRERIQRIEEWPGWVPDEKVLGMQQQQRRVQIAAEYEMAQSQRASVASRERWTNPRTWRRRAWGAVLTVGLLVLVAVIVVATTVTQDNATELTKAPRQAGLEYRIVETAFEAEGLYAPPSPSSTTLSSRHSSSFLSPAARRMARRFKGRYR